MKLTKVSARNLKGSSFEFALGAATLFVGSNFYGKSARGDALRLALTGYLPELGKTGAATFGLCSGRDLVVAAEFDDGSKIFRRWYAQGNSIRYEENLPPWLKDANEEIVAVMLNADLYFRLTEGARVNYIFDNVRLGPTVTIEELLSNFERDLFSTEGLDPKAVEELITSKETKNLIAGAGLAPQQFLEYLGDFVEANAKAAKAAVVVYEKTVQGLTSIRTSEASRSNEAEAAALANAKRSLADEVAALREEKGRLALLQERSRADRSRRDVLNRALAEGAALEAKRVAMAAEATRFSEELQAVAVEALSDDQFAGLERELADASTDYRDATREAGEMKNTIAAREKELTEIELAKLCPYCGACGTDWKVLRREELVRLVERLAADKEAADLRTERTLAAVTRIQSNVIRERTVRGLHAGKLRELEARQAALRSIERSLAVVDDNRRQLAALGEPKDYASDVDAVALKIAGKSGELNEIELRLRAHDGRRHDLTRLAQAEEARDEGLKSVAAANAAVKIVKALKAKTVEAAFAPLLESANGFFPDLLRGKLALVDGEIGWYRAGTWVGHKTFSGAEKALAYAAIQMALASRSLVRIMFLDELGKLADGNLPRFITDVGLAIQRGEIEQFVGIDTGRGVLWDSFKPPGLELAIVAFLNPEEDTLL